MTSPTTANMPISLITPTPTAPTLPKTANADRIAKTARDFEATFIAAMLQPMFDALPTAAPFGGGAGEGAFKSFLVNAVAQQTAKHGGIGLSASIQREMLKMQGAS